MRCMSISPHKGRRPTGCAGPLAVALSLLSAISTVRADAQHQTVESPARPGIVLRKHLANSLVTQLERDPQLPGAGPVVTGPERSVQVSMGSSGAWLTPVQVSYKALSNKYCMLAVSDDSMQQIRLVPLPVAALHDTCSRIRTQLLVDANGTGLRDVVQAVQIRSNRAGFEVTEALVYLADPRAKAGYCYSAAASRELSVESLRSAHAASNALRQARARLGLNAFACDQ